MREYLAVLHVYFKDEDEIAAIASADDVKIKLDNEILVDDGESCDVVEVIPSDEEPIPTANIRQLRRSRNILIRLRTKESYDIARSMDPIIDSLEHRNASHGGASGAQGNYDYGKFMRITKEIVDGNNPLEY